MYGSGYIYEKNRLRGKIATCVVKTQKEDGDALHLITSCSTNVTLATVQFSLKDNALVPLGPAGRCIKSQDQKCPVWIGSQQWSGLSPADATSVGSDAIRSTSMVA